MAATTKYFVALFSCLFCAFYSDGNEDISVIKTVLNSIERLIHYYHLNYKDLNIDGLYGLRVLEGQIQLLVEERNNHSHSHISSAIFNKLQQIKEEATNICQMAMSFVKKDDEEYFEKLNYVIGEPWLMFKRHRKINLDVRWPSLIYKHARRSALSEDTSDKCMNELTGSSNDKGPRCEVSDTCATVMTKKGLVAYSITHQILWTIMAEKAGCTKQLQSKLEKLGLGSIEHIQTEFCTNNFIEMKGMIHGKADKDGSLLVKYQDLFLEQQFVCPHIGFYEFINADYLKQMLSWQFDSGCYGDSLETDYNDDYDNEDGDNAVPKDPFAIKSNNLKEQHHQENVLLRKQIDKQNVESMKMAHPPQDAESLNFVPNDKLNKKVNTKQSNKLRQNLRNDEFHNVGRKLLVEKEMKDGCLAHKTAVAAGALVVYLRYLIDPGPLVISDKWKNINPQRFLLSEDQNDEAEEKPKKVFVVNAALKHNYYDNNKVVEKPQNSLHDNKIPDDRGNDYNDKYDDYDDKLKNKFQREDETLENKKPPALADGSHSKGLQKNKMDNNPDHGYVDGEDVDDPEGDDDDEEEEDEDDNDYDDKEKLDNTYYDDNVEEENQKPLVLKDLLPPNGKESLSDKKTNTDQDDSKKMKNILIEEFHQPPSNSVLLIYSASLLVCVFVMYKFIKRRRLHIRYNPRTCLKLFI